MLCVAAIATGITPMVRIGSQDGHLAARVLDGGAQGLMVPHINSAAEAEAIVTACRFPPIGHRSVGGAGPALGYKAMPQAEVSDFLNRETLLLAMLETPEAIEQAEAIAAVPGIDGLHIGSNDLCSEMGIPAGITTRATCTPWNRPHVRRGRTASRSASAACCSTTNCRPNSCGSARAI